MITRRILLLVMSLVAVAAGVLCGLLSWSGKAEDAPAAVLFGAGAFGSTMALLIAVVEFVERPEDDDSRGH